ncbi:MAG: hypothetical protein FWF24_00725 [Alphaproteobacteria bacterium]|nr:hypothetical protein [Alphaproteobacteria bacterium]
MAVAMDMKNEDDPAQKNQKSVSASISGIGLSWADQDDLLRQMWLDGKPQDDIAAALGRSAAAIMTRAARLGLPRRMAPGRKRGYKRTNSNERRKLAAAGSRRIRLALPEAPEEEDVYVPPEVKTRVCLMCLNKFQSQGRHNRLCSSCKGSADYATGNSTPDFTFSVSN